MISGQKAEGQAASVAVAIRRVEGSQSSRVDDRLAVEEALEIRLGDRNLSITMRTPGNDFELAVGFLHAEGIIRQSDDIRFLGRPPDGNQNIVVLELRESAKGPVRPKRNFVMTSACGVCGKASLRDLQANACPKLPPNDFELSPEIIYSLPSRLREAQSVFEATGGLHAAAMFDSTGHLQAIREDVGRHNAVDKLIGASLMNHDLPLSRSILLVSGRASFELVQKALMAGIPVMAAVGAPSSLAVSTADRAGMTLIGFLRKDRFNVYTGRGQIREWESQR